MVTGRWTKNGTVFSGVPGRVTLNEQRPTSSVFIRTVVFSPLSSSMDNGTYACMVTLTPLRPQFVNTVNRSQSISLAIQGEITIHATLPRQKYANQLLTDFVACMFSFHYAQYIIKYPLQLHNRGAGT